MAVVGGAARLLSEGERGQRGRVDARWQEYIDRESEGFSSGQTCRRSKI